MYVVHCAWLLWCSVPAGHLHTQHWGVRGMHVGVDLVRSPSAWGGLCVAFCCCSATVVSNYTPYTRPAGGHSGATSHPRQGVGLIPVRPQPLDSLHFPPPSQLSPYLCQPQLQWLESWPDNSASCSPPMPREAHRGPCPRASWVGGFPPHSGWRLGSKPWLTTPTRSGFGLVAGYASGVQDWPAQLSTVQVVCIVPPLGPGSLAGGWRVPATAGGCRVHDGPV